MMPLSFLYVLALAPTITCRREQARAAMKAPFKERLASLLAPATVRRSWPYLSTAHCALLA
jgi:hypothetical protein